MKKCSCTTLFIALIILFTTPLAFGQALDGLWFQAKGNFKGYTVDGSGLLDKASVNTVNYFHLTWNVTNTNYYITNYDEAGNGMNGDVEIATVGTNEDIVHDLTLQLGQVSSPLFAYQTCLIKIKRDSHGFVKSVTFNSMGCESYNGYINGNEFFGGCTMKAKKIDSPPFPG